MFTRTRTALLALLLLVPATAALALGQGRLQAQVVDQDGKPLAGVQVAISNDEIAYKNELTTDKRGRFSLLVIDATRMYVFRFSKEGYQTVEKQVKLDPGGVKRETYTLPPAGVGGGGAAASSAPAVVEGHNKAINAYNAGVGALQADDRATAEQKFREAIEIDPEMSQPYAVLGGLYLDDEKYDEAIAMADKLLELDPQSAKALITLYDAYHAKGDKEKARAALDQLGSIAGGGNDAAIRIYNEGADAAKSGDLTTALALFEKAVQVDPELAPGWAAAARLYLAKEQYQQAVDAAEKALAADPGMVDIQRVRYEGYRQLGQDEKAKQVFDEISAADPEGLAQTLYEQGRELFNDGHTDQARDAFEQAVQAKPDHARAHYMLGLCYANLGNNAKAKEHLQKFLQLAPEDPEAATAKQMLDYMG